MKHIIENATILYKSGVKQMFNAIHITKKGIYTGRIIVKDEQEDVFEDHGFIPRDQIEKIMVCNEHEKARDIDF